MSDSSDKLLLDALQKIDAANSQDPRTTVFAGETLPRELAFSKCVYAWVQKLVPAPSASLLLAARGHTVRRWCIPRDEYPKTTKGYHAWRNALATYHADQLAEILVDIGYDAEAVSKVRALTTKDNWPENDEAAALEDADCLAFIEMKLVDYVDDWDENKMFRVLQGTLRKMTPKARQAIRTLPLGDRERALLDGVSV